MKVCIIGLGYVGLTLGVYLARKGLRVHGVDISEQILICLNEKKSPFFEEGFAAELDETIKSENFTFSAAYPKFNCNTAYIITVGTPLGKDGSVNLSSLQVVTRDISSMLRDGDLVILRSTVKIGTTREQVKPVLDRTGKTYSLGYCPERTLEGKAFEELASLPQIISGIDANSQENIRNFFAPVCNETIDASSVEEAEMAKLLNNSERDLMFALANEIAFMCEVKGLDANNIIKISNYNYSRSNLKKPGLVGGPCLEKDPYILTESFDHESYQPKLFTAGRQINETVAPSSLERFFRHYVNKTGKDPYNIAVLGFAFKGAPPTSDVRGSLVYTIIECIKKKFPQATIIGHDYLVTEEDMVQAGARSGCNAIEKVITDSDIVILQNNHPSYASEAWVTLHKLMSKDALIFDFWNQLDVNCFDDTSIYNAFGNGALSTVTSV